MEEVMHRTKSLFIALLLAVAPGARAADPTPAPAAAPSPLELLKKDILRDPMAAPALQKFAIEQLLPESVNPVFVRAVREQNARRVPLEKIKAIDAEWIAGGSTTPFKTTLLAVPASAELRRFAEKEKAVREAFLMDNQGAVVGETNLTSDYWQGDEKKWTESFKGPHGTAFIDAAQFDASARVVLQQISLPVLDEGGKVIGAITWGVVLDKINWKEQPAQ
jgi:hypothetical protein